MVKRGYILSETDRSILSQTVAKVNGSPLTPSKLNRRHRDPAGGGMEYTGYFKVIDASEVENGTVKLKIKVVDGAAEDSENCGTAWINNKRLQIKAVEKSVAGSGGFVYLKASLSETGVVTEETTEIVVMSSPPQFWTDMSYTLIARLFVTGESMRIVQESHGEIKAVIWGECQ